MIFLILFCIISKVTLGLGKYSDSISLQPKSCECVPYYLCAQGEDSSNVINIGLDGEKPCPDYLQVCCEADRITKEPITPKPNPNQSCGLRNVYGLGFRISSARDNEAQFAEFPWMIGLLREEIFPEEHLTLYRYQCGGSLIHPKVVLTAAHCLAVRSKKYRIRAGEWDTQTEKELYKYQEREVAEIITHPDYYAGGFFNDVALLILEDGLDIAPHVDTVCLPPPGLVVDSSKCFVTGWGKDVYGKKGVYQVFLKKIELGIVARDVCERSLRTTPLGETFVLHESLICAGGQSGEGACQGDGGSPLVCIVPGMWNKYYQAGIVAWGTSCGEDNIPSAYANVPLFVDWINQELSKHGLDSSYCTY